jgi:hypothetical protein
LASLSLLSFVGCTFALTLFEFEFEFEFDLDLDLLRLTDFLTIYIL